MHLNLKVHVTFVLYTEKYSKYSMIRGKKGDGPSFSFLIWDFSIKYTHLFSYNTSCYFLRTRLVSLCSMNFPSWIVVSGNKSCYIILYISCHVPHYQLDKFLQRKDDHYELTWLVITTWSIFYNTKKQNETGSSIPLATHQWLSFSLLVRVDSVHHNYYTDEKDPLYPRKKKFLDFSL